MATQPESRRVRLGERLVLLRAQAERLPGAPTVVRALRSEDERGGGLIAGGVAFRLFLWLVPFGLVAAATLSLWDDLDAESMESAAREFGIGAASAKAAAEALEGDPRNAFVGLLFGLVLLAWFTLGAVRALSRAYTIAWGMPRRRLAHPANAILGFNGLLVLAIGVSSGSAWLREQVGATALVGSVVGAAGIAVIALLAMWLLPHRAARPRELVPGALLVAAGHQLVNVLVVFYFAPKLGDSEETYGALGTAATLLVWLYVLARLATGAAFLNATLWEQRQSVSASEPA